MAKVRSREKSKREMPSILTEFATWLEDYDDNSVGYFELSDDPPGEGYFESKEEEVKLQSKALLFARTPDGSEIVVIDRGNGLPCPVVLLNSEGGEETIAGSPEEFLVLLSKGETGNFDLDDEEATARKVLAAWLKKKKVKAIPAPPFDLGAFLEGRDNPAPEASAPAAALPPPPSGEVYDTLPEGIRRLALFVGRPATDPELVAFVTSELGKKMPTSLSWSKEYAWVEAAKKHGIDLLFESHVYHDAYPEIPKSKSSLIPYLSSVCFRDNYKDPLPFGITRDMDAAALEAKLGPPLGVNPKKNIAYWHPSIDAGRGIICDIRSGGDRCTLCIDTALVLSTGNVPSKPVVGLFVAWALLRGLLDTARFPAHAGLIAQIKAREKKGSDLVDTALSRGLWNNHLSDRPDLRQFVYGWFHNIGGRFIRDDLVQVFGSREGKYGHQEPVLDDDTWDAVDRATEHLDSVFSAWVDQG